MFQDMNGNNVYDEGTDTVLPNIQVKITGKTTTGADVDTMVTTDDKGRARSTLREGEYTATIVNPPAGMTQVTPKTGSDDKVDSDFDNNVATFTVKSRETTARDGGFFVPMGTFHLDKALTGDAASWVAASTEFTVDYSYPAGAAYPAGSGVVKIKADGTQVESPKIPVGAVVTLKEQAPAAIAGAKWGTPTYSENGFTITNGSQLTEVTVTNPIEPTFGTFAVKKAITGEAASLVPADAEFTVEYSYPAGKHFPAGNGELKVKADGTAATSPKLPHGAVVTIKEQAPAPIANTVWADPTYSSENVTIEGDQAQPALTVTNQLDMLYGTFDVKKALTGEAASVVPADTEFTVEYSYPAGEGFAAGSGEIVITADGTAVTSPKIPYGAKVTLQEQAPAAIANTVWGDPELSTDTIEMGALSSGVVVTVTNPIELAYGKIAVAKKVAGDGADRVAKDAQFTVHYTYPAGPGYEAGEGDVKVTADGAAVESEQVPAGAVVTIEEQKPENGADYKWTGVEYSATDATVVADQTAEFTVTNTATKVDQPVTPTEPGEPGVPAKPTLPITGAGAGWMLGAVAGALLIGGAVLLLVRRKAAGE
ncbi:DUF5979 domain-containing protein [Leucobacter edaphi]|nr:DUF5979 domain-containing protein [Leucobacter edaphi]